MHLALRIVIWELQLGVHRGVGLGLVWGWFCLVSCGFPYMFKEWLMNDDGDDGDDGCGA